MWVLFITHRPMGCSSDSLRQGIPSALSLCQHIDMSMLLGMSGWILHSQALAPFSCVVLRPGMVGKQSLHLAQNHLSFQPPSLWRCADVLAKSNHALAPGLPVPTTLSVPSLYSKLLGSGHLYLWNLLYFLPLWLEALIAWWLSGEMMLLASIAPVPMLLSLWVMTP